MAHDEWYHRMGHNEEACVSGIEAIVKMIPERSDGSMRITVASNWRPRKNSFIVDKQSMMPTVMKSWNIG